MAAIAAVFYREGKIRSTNLTFIFWDLFYPLCYMLVFGVGINSALGSPMQSAGVDYNAFFLAGVLGMASFGIASNTAWSFFLDRDNGIFYEMLTYPLSRGEYLLGKVMFNVLIGVFQAGITVTLGRLLLGIRVRWDLLPLLFAGVVVGTAGWFFFYAIFALRTRRNDVFNSVTSIFYFVFLFASSMFYPLAPLPLWFRKVAIFNPITWEIDWLRFTSIGLGNARLVGIEGVAFLLFTLASFAFAVRALQQQE
ncbi:MAG TPA: ABC transporter permease [Candidatus Dormibacteraeota bacterium]|nr:ABC transporter permease [Candidatus Dormibacteraeota bacterium]